MGGSYDVFGDFATLLNHPKSLVRNRALFILAANVRWDDEKNIKALAQIGQAKQQYIPTILSALRSADVSQYKDSMRLLIEKDIVEVE